MRFECGVGMKGRSQATAGQLFAIFIGLVTSISNAASAMVDPASLGIKTISGSCGPLSGGMVNGAATSAKFEAPTGIALGPNGTWIAIADDLNNRVRRLSNDVVDTLAGSDEMGFRDATKEAALFRRPVAVAISNDGTWAAVCALLLAPLPLSLPVLDSCTQLPALLLRRLFKHAKVCGSDSEGEQIADRENSLIRRVSVPDGVVTTIAGVGSKGYTDGAAADAKFNTPTGLAISPDDTWIAVADSGNHAIRKVDAVTGATETLAGAGPGLGQGSSGFTNGHPTNEGRLNTPKAVTFRADGAWLAIADSGNRAIRALSLSEAGPSTLDTWAGGSGAGLVDGSVEDARFEEPLGLAFSPQSEALYIADGGNRRVRVLLMAGDAPSQVWTVNGTGGLEGGGFAEFAELMQPSDVAVSPGGDWMVVSLSEGNCIVNISVVTPLPPPPPPTSSPTVASTFSAVVYANTASLRPCPLPILAFSMLVALTSFALKQHR